MKTIPRIKPKLRPMALSRLLVSISLTGLMGCGVFVAEDKDRPARVPYSSAGPAALQLSPAQDYAGEILAYFLQIAVGHIGSEESRLAWRSTGNDAAMDFQHISKIMSQPAVSKTDLMVLDFDLMGLLEVLSHYNPSFNQFKGRYIFSSVYPSSELIAIRLLIQRKLNQGERVSLTALQKQETLLRPHAEFPSPADLKAMNLSAIEFQLVKDVFNSDPLFFQYYKHPFIVDAMTRIGFFQKDRLTEEIIRNASYKPYAPRHHQPRSDQKRVQVVVLPSFTREFEFGGEYEAPYLYGFKPSKNYLQAVEKLKSEILSRTAHQLFAELKNSGQAESVNDVIWKRLWVDTYAPLIHFKLYDLRPFTIYPENANRLVKEICPEADLVILLLGEGIDRTLDVTQGTDDFYSTGRLYFNLDDIRYYRRNDKIDEIAQGIVRRLLTIGVSAKDSAALKPWNTANLIESTLTEDESCALSTCW